METKRTNFEMNETEKMNAILKTICHMLIARNWIPNETDKYVQKMKDKGDENMDMTSIETKIGKIGIKFYNSRLNTLKNDKEINNFLTTYEKEHKILIVQEITPKAEKQILEIKDLEIFKKSELIFDIAERHDVPKHILLSKDDALRMMDEYKVKKKDLGRIYIDDPMARYLYAQKDDIIMIIRNTITSGYSTYYRLVVSGSIYN